MANLNKVMLIGRLTHPPEVRTFANGGKVAKIRFAVNNRKKNANGQWEKEPVYIDCDIFNRGETGKMADLAEQYLAKGNQVYLEGHLKLDSWTDKNGEKRSKLMMVVDVMEFLEQRQEGMGGGGMPESAGNYTPRSTAPAPAARKPAPGYASNGGGSYDMEEPDRDSSFGGPGGNGSDDDIPF